MVSMVGLIFAGALLACTLGVAFAFTYWQNRLEKDAHVQMFALFIVFWAAFSFQAKGWSFMFAKNDQAPFVIAVVSTLSEFGIALRLASKLIWRRVLEKWLRFEPEPFAPALQRFRPTPEGIANVKTILFPDRDKPTHG